MLDIARQLPVVALLAAITTFSVISSGARGTAGSLAAPVQNFSPSSERQVGRSTVSHVDEREVQIGVSEQTGRGRWRRPMRIREYRTREEKRDAALFAREVVTERRGFLNRLFGSRRHSILVTEHGVEHQMGVRRGMVHLPNAARMPLEEFREHLRHPDGLANALNATDALHEDSRALPGVRLVTNGNHYGAITYLFEKTDKTADGRRITARTYYRGIHHVPVAREVIVHRRFGRGAAEHKFIVREQTPSEGRTVENAYRVRDGIVEVQGFKEPLTRYRHELLNGK